jgi:hypothetical protein
MQSMNVVRSSHKQPMAKRSEVGLDLSEIPEGIASPEKHQPNATVQTCTSVWYQQKMLLLLLQKHMSSQIDSRHSP